MNKLNTSLIVMFVWMLLLLAGCTRINPDEIGVRSVNFGSKGGIVPKDYEPGYHRFLWPLDSWHRFPSTVQSLAFVKDGGRGSGPDGPLQISSGDGDRVTIDAEVFFQIKPNHANRVLQDSGPGERYLDVVRGLSQDAARAVFGRIGTEQFYDQASRQQALDDATELLSQRLDERGIMLVDLLVSSVAFDSNYEKLIKQKKIADQRVELELAKSRAAEERGRVEKLRAETNVKVQKVDREKEARLTAMRTDTDMQIAAMRSEAQKYVSQRTADADLYHAHRVAEGKRLVGLAEADGSRRKNEALAGDGSRNLVALEALRNINLGDVSFPSIGYEWFNPFDMAGRVGATNQRNENVPVPLAPVAPNPDIVTEQVQ